MIETALYLIPVPLSDVATDTVLPAANTAIVRHIKHFIVENVRSARRFLKKCDREIDIDSLTFFTLNRHTPTEEIASFLEPLKQGCPMGVISEAGCPAIADPGADVVAIAQRQQLRLSPLVGRASPSAATSPSMPPSVHANSRIWSKPFAASTRRKSSSRLPIATTASSPRW